MAAALRWIVQMHRDVPKAARFYADGLDFTLNVCTLRWAELQSGPLKLALMHSEYNPLSRYSIRFLGNWKVFFFPTSQLGI
jgi:hypothetical protein